MVVGRSAPAPAGRPLRRDMDDMDDASILAFWCGESPEEGPGDGSAEETGDARTFRGALEQVARLRSAMQAGCRSQRGGAHVRCASSSISRWR